MLGMSAFSVWTEFSVTTAKKVHSLIDKVYKRKNLEMAWQKVKANRGSGGVDGQTLEAFEAQLNQQLERLQRELKEDSYSLAPVDAPTDLFFISNTCLRACSVLIHTKQRPAP